MWSTTRAAGSSQAISPRPTGTPNRSCGSSAELGLAVEASVQHRLDTGLWSPFFSYVYVAAQLVVLPGSLVWLYRRAPGIYRPLRNTVLGTWLIAIPIYALFPVTPPRLAHAGIVDAVSEQAGFALTGRSTFFFNPLLWGPLGSLSVVVTGNHY